MAHPIHSAHLLVLGAGTRPGLWVMAGSSGRSQPAISSRCHRDPELPCVVILVGKGFFSCLSFVLSPPVIAIELGVGRGLLARLIFHQKCRLGPSPWDSTGDEGGMGRQTSATPGTRTVPQEDPSVLIPQRDCLQGTCRAESRRSWLLGGRVAGQGHQILEWVLGVEMWRVPDGSVGEVGGGCLRQDGRGREMQG